VYWVYSLLAIRSLDTESAKVIRDLAAGDMEKARRSVSMIVGRDTANLDEIGILRAAIETVSENVSDGIIAPLFYLALFGPAGMAAYKAVNTLDSMIGYKNEQYREIGWASARLDDVLNFLPSRLTAALVWVAAGILGMNLRRSLSITLRDGGSQPSPNSGWPEAAFAGALGVRLGGTNYYRGMPSQRAYLGDPIQPLSTEVFRSSRRLLYVSSLLMVVAVALWK
jgi:adenosylcobinamide-phosphate synthase